MCNDSSGWMSVRDFLVGCLYSCKVLLNYFFPTELSVSRLYQWWSVQTFEQTRTYVENKFELLSKQASLNIKHILLECDILMTSKQDFFILRAC